MDIKWDNECERCGTGCTHDYCHDCQMLGHDPSLSNYNKKTEEGVIKGVIKGVNKKT